MAFQNYPTERMVYLTLDGEPSTGILYTDIVVKYKKQGETALTTKTLAASDWIDLGSGQYSLSFSAEEMDTIGTFYYTIISNKFDNFVFDELQVGPQAAGSGGSELSIVIQNYPTERALYLTLADIPVTDIAYTDIIVKYKKQGQTSLSTKNLTANDWVNLGGGDYILKFNSSDMDTFGLYYYTIISNKFDNFVFDEFQIIPLPTAPSESVPPDMCVLSGSLKSIGGTADRNYAVIIRPVEFPARYGANILAADKIKTYTDAYGHFSVSLVRNSIVIVEIERFGIRHQITIPDQPTADLLSLLPPFINDYT